MIKLDEIDELGINEINKLYSEHVSIGIPKILRMLGFEKETPEFAEGMYIYTKNIVRYIEIKLLSTGLRPRRKNSENIELSN